MSARDELFRRVAGAFVDEDRANALIDAYAHELAEQIRRHWSPRPPFTSDDYVRGLADGFDGAADLIDPAHFSDSQ